MLKETFIHLLRNYTNNTQLENELWDEIEKQYTSKKRHYHNLGHLEAVLERLQTMKAEIENWDTVLFSLFYHDVIYNPLKTDNEEKSAERAEKRMRQIAVSGDRIAHCKRQILATKSHETSTDHDTNYFTDADLSILGEEWEIYAAYCENVRKEYAIFPDFVYNPGRKKVLEHFLRMERIFKTDYFFERFEKQAKQNIARELQGL